MRTIYLQFSLLLLFIGLITSCNKGISDTDNSFSVQIGDAVKLTKNEIEYYDFSSHILYLNNKVTLNRNKLANTKFWVNVGNECIYSGMAFYNYTDSLEIIDYAFLEFAYSITTGVQLSCLQDFNDISNNEYNPCSDERIKQALISDGLYHSGLSCSIDTVVRGENNEVTLKFRLTNSDTFNYYYLDPDKVDQGKYQYYTNGLSLYQWYPFAWFGNNVAPVTPEIYCGCNYDLFSLIKSGESRLITITYPNFDSFEPGDYCAVFRFHGEHIFIPIDCDLFDNGKIWIGDIQMAKNITIK